MNQGLTSWDLISAPTQLAKTTAEGTMELKLVSKQSSNQHQKK